MFSSPRNGAVSFVLWLYLFAQAHSLTYSELQTLCVSCYPRDSCHSRSLQPTEDDANDESTCECDATCHRRGTCCIDSQYADPCLSTRSEVCSRKKITGVHHNYHFNHTTSTSFYQVAKCDRLWNGSVQVKERCEIEEPVDGVDLMVAIPVTNTYTGITYKNYFCALCNNDLEGSVLWDFSFKESSYLEGFQLGHRFTIQACEAPADSSADTIGEGTGSCDYRYALPLVYSEEERSYGYWYNFYNGLRYISVSVNISIPADLESYVKGCRPDLVSTCPPGWTDMQTSLKCAGYMGIIKRSELHQNDTHYDRYYRNAHCAICNNVTNFEGFSCEPFSSGTVFTGGPTYPTSFTVRLGQLLSDNGCLGDNGRFVEERGCRAVICVTQRHTVQKGKCEVH